MYFLLRVEGSNAMMSCRKLFAESRRVIQVNCMTFLRVFVQSLNAKSTVEYMLIWRIGAQHSVRQP